jgi:3-oxoacyl-[acyl-carrier protein] reductase
MPELLFVTGASSDLGGTLIRSVLSKAPSTRVIAHSHTGGARIAALVDEFGDRIYPLTSDLSDTSQVEAMASEIIAKFGCPSQMVHLPALRLKYERLSKFDLAHFRKDMAIQVEAPFILLKTFAPRMSKLPTAKIVFVLSSVTRNLPPKFMSMYSVVKYAQLGLMRAVAAEYAATGLTVNGVSPSMIETQFIGEIGDVAVRMSAASNPKGRNARPEDVIGAIEWFLSAAAGYVTGTDLAVTGGGST